MRSLLIAALFASPAFGQTKPATEKHSDIVITEPKTITTIVCSGNGRPITVNVNGKPVRSGKRGCVHVYSDGTHKSR